MEIRNHIAQQRKWKAEVMKKSRASAAATAAAALKG
jgi:hypothetical protein